MDDSVLEAEGPLDEFYPGEDASEMDMGEVVRPGTSSVLSDSGASSTAADSGSQMDVDS